MPLLRNRLITPATAMRAGLSLLLLTLAACASQPAEPVARAAYLEANDPLEPFNRTMLEFNMIADEAILEPVARVYDAVLPDPAQSAVRNVLNNLGEPITLMNDLLQGEVGRATQSLTRFVFNSTLGLGGMIDLMGEAGMEGHDEDFGQTLAVWGIGEGPYLVLPLLGPSNFRDLTGTVVDAVADPVNRTFRGHDLKAAPYIRAGTDIVDRRASLLGVIEELERTSIDYYTTVRSAYRQRRQQAILNGALPPVEDLYGSVLKEDSGVSDTARARSDVE